MQKIILFQKQSPDYHITIEAFFHKSKLVVKGYETGKDIHIEFAGNDREQATYVPKKEAAKLYKVFGLEENDDIKLLQALGKQFNTSRCYKDFNDFLADNGINKI